MICRAMYGNGAPTGMQMPMTVPHRERCGKAVAGWVATSAANPLSALTWKPTVKAPIRVCACAGEMEAVKGIDWAFQSSIIFIASYSPAYKKLQIKRAAFVQAFFCK